MNCRQLIGIRVGMLGFPNWHPISTEETVVIDPHFEMDDGCVCPTRLPIITTGWNQWSASFVLPKVESSFQSDSIDGIWFSSLHSTGMMHGEDFPAVLGFFWHSDAGILRCTHLPPSPSIRLLERCIDHSKR